MYKLYSQIYKIYTLEMYTNNTRHVYIQVITDVSLRMRGEVCNVL